MGSPKAVPRRAFLAIATVFGVSSTLQSFGLAWLRQGQAMPAMLPHLFAANMLYTDPNAADQMIDRLGDLLRMTLHFSACQAVPLKEELELLQKYVDIEQTRFGDRLTVSMHIDPETLDAQVPQLLLQPLVENAIRHGVAPNSRVGWIAIHAVRSGDDLSMEVRDSGNGLPPERLVALNRGVGLENTRARLEHLYRSSFRFAFTNLKEEFCVTVRIPFQLAPVEDRTERVNKRAPYDFEDPRRCRRR